MGMVMMIGLQHSLNIENVESRRNFHEQIYHRVSPIVMYISHICLVILKEDYDIVFVF